MNRHEIMDRSAVLAYPSPEVGQGPLLSGLDRAAFEASFNRQSFEIGHRLTGHQLLTLPSLVMLARTTAGTRPADVYFDNGDIAIGQRWSETPKLTDPVDSVVEQIENAKAWITLRNAQLDPGYGALLRALMDEIARSCGSRLTRNISKSEMIIFVASPKRVTSYHIDRECSFLFQIHGSKEISIFEQSDREVLPEDEIERFWTVDNNAAVYKPHLQHRAKTLTLKPGKGVHIPINAPHWLRNGDDVSISVNINVTYSGRERAHAYRANYYFRKIGLNPTPVRQSKILDAIKAPLGATAYRLRQLYRRVAWADVDGKLVRD